MTYSSLFNLQFTNIKNYIKVNTKVSFHNSNAKIYASYKVLYACFQRANKRQSSDVCLTNLLFWLANDVSDWTGWLGSCVTIRRAKRAKYEGGLLIYGRNAMAKFHLNWFVVIIAACVSSRLTTNATRKMWTIQPHSCSSDFQLDLKCFPKTHLHWFKLNNMAVYAGINKGSVPQMHVVIGRIGFYDQFYSKFSRT